MTRPPPRNPWSPRDVEDTLEIAWAATTVRMRARGASWRLIGLFLTQPPTSVRRRYERLSPEELKYYRTLPLDAVGL